MAIRLPFGLRDVGVELKHSSRIAGPMVLANVLMYLRYLVSGMFLGRIGEFALAGGALSTLFTNITGYSVLFGLASCMDPICSQAVGSENWELIGRTFHRTVVMLLLASLGISLLWVKMENIMLLAGQDHEIVATAKIYTLFVLPDLVNNSILHPLRAYLRNQGITVAIMWSSALALLVNVSLNFFLVSFLKLGIRGVAIATVWTNFNTVVFLLTYLCFTDVCRRTCLPWSFNFLKECIWCPFSEWWQLLVLAIPSCFAICLEWWWFELISLLAGYLPDPETTVGTMGTLITAISFLYAVPSALSSSVSTRVGNELGANRPDKAKLAMFVALGCALAFAFISLTLTMIFKHIWGRLFNQSPEGIALTAAAMPIIGFSELGNCLQTTGCGVLRATTRPSLAGRINFFSFYVVGMPIAIAMVQYWNFGFEGLWYGLLAAQTVCAITVLVAVLRTDWNLEATKARQLTGKKLVRHADGMGSAPATMPETDGYGQGLLSHETHMPPDEETEVVDLLA